MTPRKARFYLISPLAALGFAALSGCSVIGPPQQPRGIRVDADQLKQLVPGTSTEADATALLGSPTAKGTFDPNTWIYVSLLTRPVVAGTNAVDHQEVVQLRFDGQGVLRHVDRLDGKNALGATMVARTTPSPGTEASVLQQLFGNIGRFNPAGLAKATSSQNGIGSRNLHQ